MKKRKVSQNSAEKRVKGIGVKEIKTLNKQLLAQKKEEVVSFEKV